MLQQLRACGILHRDFKSHNIVVSKDRRLCLIDFGSAVEYKHRMAMTGRLLTTAHVRAPEVICGSRIYSYAIDVWAAGCVIWRKLTGGDLLFPNLQSKILRTKRDQVKYHIGELRNILGTSVRCTKQGNIPRCSEQLYHEIRSWPPRERIVAQTFFERRCNQEKNQKILKLDRSSSKNACSLVCKLLWWFDHERLKISTKSGWRERLIFLALDGERQMPNHTTQKTRFFKPFYSFCDISEVILKPNTAPRATGRKRARGGRVAIRKKKNRRAKKEILECTKN